MFSPVAVIIDAFTAEIRRAYLTAFPHQEPTFADLLESTARTSLETLANTDAPYHDMEHTILVTEVGQEILRAKLQADGGITPLDWVHFVVSLLFHDVGYVRGVCRADRGGRYVINDLGQMVTPPAGATDAYLTPYHVDRGKIFVRERFTDDLILDVEVICNNIEHTRFPVPAADDYQRVDDFPGLIRAADLIGQLADPRYIQKLSRLYTEFLETGEAERLGYRHANELREAYPAFFWDVVSPFITDGLRLLRKTQGGQQVIANLFAHVFEVEHEAPAYGPERRSGKDRRQGESQPPSGRNRRTQPRGRRASDRIGAQPHPDEPVRRATKP
ncbi:MAG: metal-dependent phosphohydrolase [Gammaproteobacteria bacterium]|nr:metal-dependent phosphohydrolase [Gammaproteobacteria bacterium]